MLFTKKKSSYVRKKLLLLNLSFLSSISKKFITQCDHQYLNKSREKQRKFWGILKHIIISYKSNFNYDCVKGSDRKNGNNPIWHKNVTPSWQWKCMWKSKSNLSFWVFLYLF